MKPFQTLACFLALAAAAAFGQKVDYSGYKVLKANVASPDVAKVLQGLEETNEFNFWNNIRIGHTADIMASPETLLKLKIFLDRNGIEFETMVEDVEELAKLGPMKPTGPKVNPKQGHNMDWDDYHTLEDIYSFFDYLEANFDDVTTEIIGQTYEGRDVRALSLCQGTCGDNPGMYMDAGIHAREWIGPATNMYMLNELTVNRGPDNQDLVDNLDWYFIASVNPDGYEYTWTTDRMWRKTRKPNEGSLCVGTDANRNYDMHWGELGSSDNPCSESYHGTEVWSEVESQNIRDFVLGLSNVVFSDSIHSYSQLILLPYGWTSDLPANYDEQKRVGDLANAALFDVHGKDYECGNTFDTIYPASGLTLDWAYEKAGVPYSYSMELRDKGLYGFQLPAEQIIPTGEEVWAFHQVVGREMISKFK